MFTPTLIRRSYWGAECLLLAAVVGAAAWLSRSEEWRPLTLVALLLGLALVGEWFSVKTHSGEVSSSFVALVLAMALLGPTPAVAFGLAAMIFISARRRLRPADWLANLTTFAVILFASGWIVRWLAGDVHDPGDHRLTQGVTFGLIVYAVFLLATGLNFLMIALHAHIDDGRSFEAEVREFFFPMLPGQLATGALATLLAIAYTNLGLTTLLAAVAIVLIFQYLTIALLRSEERADNLQARTIQLSSLQFGVLAMLLDALALRDPPAGRHAAAVARYAKALAIEIGCTEEEQDVIHTAGLLHDIGKFTWSDRVLHPEALTDDDWAVIRRHPQDGAALVGKLDGYGPVADAILYHHERIDGRGYPAGLIGSEIPLASRIVAICSTYDTMTAGQTYRTPMPAEEALAELRRSAKGQLDAELVESFIGLLERERDTFAQKADYETELAFDRRVRRMARSNPAARVGSSGKR
jgi:putative nucleotidyltransferase with HDIG domain